MIDYFRLQYTIICRKIEAFGLPPLLGGVLGAIVFLALSFYIFYKTEFAPYLYVLLCVSFVGKLSDPARNEFLKVCFTKATYQTLRICENAIIAFPFLLFLLYKQAWGASGLLVLVSLGMSYGSFSGSSGNSLPTPFSRQPFEFAQGFRQSYWVIVAAYAIAIAAVAVGNVNLGIFTILMVFMTAISYYGQPEPIYYMWIFRRNPTQFLAMKLSQACWHITIMILPIALLLLLFFREHWHLIVIFAGLGYGYLTVMVLGKYAAYPKEMSVPQGIIFVLCFVMPPMLLLAAPYFYTKAIQQIKVHLQ